MGFQFGGHSDGEEDSLNVAKREIMEEAGITNFELGTNSIYDVARGFNVVFASCSNINHTIHKTHLYTF